mgnify:CR=1 FL=1
MVMYSIYLIAKDKVLWLESSRILGSEYGKF